MIDWNDAFDNSRFTDDMTALAAKWASQASETRIALKSAGNVLLDQRYGEAERNLFDLFLPKESAKGLVVFVHGGFWMRFDKSFWSHLALGAHASGWAVAVPSYTLSPQARLSEITNEIASAITAAAAMVDGPICLAGHSAGGHLVSRMACGNGPLSQDIAERLVKVVSISGLHDMRPLLHNKMNDTFGMDLAEAEAESIVLQRPLPHVRVCFWVGAAERPEFVRQTRLACEVWSGCSDKISDHFDTGRHHFDVIDGLSEPDSPIVSELLTP